MLLKSQGIVLHTLKYNDDSLIVDVLTEAVGRVSFMVRISRSPRTAVRHTLFRPMALLDLEWNHRPGTTGLRRPKSAQTAVPLVSLPYDPHKAAMSLFLAEFLHHAVRDESEPGALFRYIFQSVEWLDTCRRGFANFHLVFLMRLSRFLGFAPNLEDWRPGDFFDLEASRFVALRPLHGHCLVPEDAARLPLLSRMNFGTMHVFRFSGSERSRLLGYINEYYRLHLPDFPELKSLAVLKDMFSGSQE